MAVPRLEELKVRVVVTVEAIVVSLMASMSHDEIAMFLGENHIALRIELELQRLALFVTGVTIEAGCIATRSDQFTGGHAHGRGVGEVRRDRGPVLPGRGPAP